MKCQFVIKLIVIILTILIQGAKQTIGIYFTAKGNMCGWLTLRRNISYICTCLCTKNKIDGNAENNC